MGVYDKSNQFPLRLDERQLIHDTTTTERDEFQNDTSIQSPTSSDSSYEPPTTATITSNGLVTTPTNSLSGVSVAAKDDTGINPQAAEGNINPPVETLTTAGTNIDMNRNSNGDVLQVVVESSDTTSNRNVQDETPNTSVGGCCAATEAFEVEYDRERFARFRKKNRKNIFGTIASFSYRWKSFKDDQLAILRVRQRAGEGDDNDDGTLSSGDSFNSFGYYNDNNGNDDIETSSSNSGGYQHFGRLSSCGKSKRRNSNNHKRHKPSPPSSFREDAGVAAGAVALEAPHDLGILAHHGYNEYARRQLEVWRAATIEGPRVFKTTAFVLALILLVCAVGMTMIVERREHFWTPGAVVALCHMVISALLILLLESRSNLTGKGMLGDLVTCGCSGKTVEDDLTEHSYNYHATILPMDAYREYGDRYYHHSSGCCSEHNDHIAAKPRNDVIRNVRLFRYMFGRGGLCIFCGSMAFCTIPGHLTDYPGAVLALCLPGIALIGVGAIAILAGVYATFRWTLLETSIIGDDDHLFEKYRSAGHSLLDDGYDPRGNSNSSNNSSIRLDQAEFSVLVTTLGLDLDETTLIPTVFALEVRPKDPKSVTFDEFQKWWRGGRCGETRHKRSRSHGTTATSGKESALIS